MSTGLCVTQYKALLIETRILSILDVLSQTQGMVELPTRVVRTQIQYEALFGEGCDWMMTQKDNCLLELMPAGGESRRGISFVTSLSCFATPASESTRTLRVRIENLDGLNRLIFVPDTMPVTSIYDGWRERNAVCHLGTSALAESDSLWAAGLSASVRYPPTNREERRLRQGVRAKSNTSLMRLR